VEKAASQGANVVVLPEIFTSPYERDEMLKNREQANSSGKTYCFLSNLAKSLKIYIIGGSIPEEISET